MKEPETPSNMNKIFSDNCVPALGAYQKEMNAYGLVVSHNTTDWVDFDSKRDSMGYMTYGPLRYYLRMRTEPLPVKGNKALIDRLKADGYNVEKRARTDLVNGRYYVFAVCRDTVIKTGMGRR